MCFGGGSFLGFFGVVFFFAVLFGFVFVVGLGEGRCCWFDFGVWGGGVRVWFFFSGGMVWGG